MKKTEPKDPTAAKRAAALKSRLVKSGGKRLAVNLSGAHVKKLDQLVKRQKGASHSDVIRVLIDEA